MAGEHGSGEDAPNGGYTIEYFTSPIFATSGREVNGSFRIVCDIEDVDGQRDSCSDTEAEVVFSKILRGGREKILGRSLWMIPDAWYEDDFTIVYPGPGLYKLKLSVDEATRVLRSVVV
jgi:hypothetical protein